MNLRWLWLDYVDRDLPLTRQQRRARRGYWLRDFDDQSKNCPECGAKRVSMPTAAKEDVS